MLRVFWWGGGSHVMTCVPARERVFPLVQCGLILYSLAPCLRQTHHTNVCVAEIVFCGPNNASGESL